MPITAVAIEFSQGIRTPIRAKFIRTKKLHVYLQLSEEAAAEAQIPPFIQNYHSLYPLEDMMLAAEHPSSSLGVRTCLMKGISVVDGGAYTLRRIDGLEVTLWNRVEFKIAYSFMGVGMIDLKILMLGIPRLSLEDLMVSHWLIFWWIQVEPSQFLLRCGQDAVKRWSIVANHPNLVGLRNVLASSAMKNVLSLYIVHDYHPGSVGSLLTSQTMLCFAFSRQSCWGRLWECLDSHGFNENHLNVWPPNYQAFGFCELFLCLNLFAVFPR